ncbi:MAG: type II toxin-antitoxin system Phd/YefM family antitoxin [Alphaproteobacteria bacterium]|nr:type II toxin-antitoxin system Phd/YefM family antitoxin [Alphaproteobacteria bacterium]
MSESKWTLQDAKNKFSAVVDAAVRGTPQHVTRRGMPAVVVVSAEEFERLREAKERRLTFKEHLLAMPKGDIEFERAELEGREVDFER